MKTPHPYRLRPYHNPEGIDESKVPPGWRFRYADEMMTPTEAAMFKLSVGWRASGHGICASYTYIVPVA